MPRPSRQPPAELVEGWPNKPSDNTIVETARVIAVNLRNALTENGLSLRGASELTKVDHTTIADVLNGNTWADMHTLARLEQVLGGLWPRHGDLGIAAIVVDPKNPKRAREQLVDAKALAKATAELADRPATD